MYTKIKKEWPALRSLLVKEIKTLSMIRDLEIETGGEYERYFINMVLQCCNFKGFNSEAVAQEIKKNNKDFFSTLYELTFSATYIDEINNEDPYKCYVEAFKRINAETLLSNNYLLVNNTSISINDINEMLYSDYVFYVQKLQKL